MAIVGRRLVAGSLCAYSRKRLRLTVVAWLCGMSGFPSDGMGISDFSCSCSVAVLCYGKP